MPVLPGRPAKPETPCSCRTAVPISPGWGLQVQVHEADGVRRGCKAGRAFDRDVFRNPDNAGSRRIGHRAGRDRSRPKCAEVQNQPCGGRTGQQSPQVLNHHNCPGHETADEKGCLVFCGFNPRRGASAAWTWLDTHPAADTLHRRCGGQFSKP